MKRALLFFTLAVGVVALPQVAKSQDETALQERLRWIHSVPMSGALYHALMQKEGQITAPAPPSPGRSPDPDVFNYPFPYPSYPATNDSPNQDVEPSVSNVLWNGVRYITTAYISYSSVSPHLPSLHTATTTTNFATFTPGTLALPSGYTQSWDPYLASDNSTGRMWAVGIAASPPLTGVCVWYSDNGGSTWSAPVLVADNSSNMSFLLDKPHIVFNPINGHVFVT